MVVGPDVAGRRGRFETMMNAVRPRGETQETAASETGLVGTARLRIVDRDRAVQPWVSADGRWSMSYNGEVFNFQDLRRELLAAGRPLRSDSDTEVMLESFLAWGADCLLRFRGEFAFAVHDRETDEVLLARDPAGVKPLYWARAEGHAYVASEVKALVPLGVPVHEVPPGHTGWLSPQRDAVTEPYIDLWRLGEDAPPLADVDEAAAELRRVLGESIALRVATDLRVGVVLSGGLDSSLVMTHVARLHPDCVAYTVGTPGSADVEYAARLARDLGIHHEVVTVRPGDVRAAEVREAVRVSEASEYGDAINAVVSLRVFERVRDTGVKVVLTGDGSDELFGGYDMYRRVSDTDRRQLFLHKIRHLSRTELQRVDRTSMGRRVEARVPFLDIAMLQLSMRIPADLKVRDGYEKWIVREAFRDELPAYVLSRHKDPLSHSSGLHDRVRLFKPLMPRWYREFGYDALGPMRRDFSRVLKDSGDDLAAAVAAAASPRDYTVAEHARDFAGALRWNVVRAVRDRH